MFRVLLRYLANNERLVNALSESYIIRRAAQLTISAFYKGKAFATEKNLDKLTPQRFRSFMEAFRKHANKELEAVKKELEQKK